MVLVSFFLPTVFMFMKQLLQQKMSTFFLCAFVLLMSGCGGSGKKGSRLARQSAPTKRIQEMNRNEAVEAKKYYSEQQDMELLKRVLLHLKSIERDAQALATTTIELADLYLRSGEYEQAQKIYQEFVTRFPGHAEIVGVRYRHLMSVWLRSLEPDRDQSVTREAVAQGTTFLTDFPDQNNYLSKVEDILCSCYSRLLASELKVVRFYLNSYNYQRKESSLEAALARIMGLRSQLLPALIRYDRAQAARWQDGLERLEKHPTELSADEQLSWILGEEQFLMQILGGVAGGETHPRDIF